MKVLHVCLAAFFPDNYTYQENMLPKYHKQLGYDVEVIASLLTFDKNGNAVYMDKPSTYKNEYDIKVTRLQNKKPLKLMRRLRVFDGTEKALNEAKPDIIFIHNGTFLDILVFKEYLKKHPNVRVYVDNHGDFSNSARNWVSLNILHKGLWRWCIRQIEPYTTKFYGVLPTRVDFLKDVYHTPGNKTELLVMGADDEMVNAAHDPSVRQDIRENLNLSEKDFVIITGGKIDHFKKQTLYLMEAVHQLNMPNVKLVVFGSVVEDMQESVRNLSHDNVQYIGWINSQDAYQYFAASDLGVFPGRHSVLWEQAVGTGLPLVVKEWPGTKHVDIGGNIVFLVNDSIEEIRTVISDIISQPGKYEQMKHAAQTKGLKSFSYLEIARRSIGASAENE